MTDSAPRPRAHSVLAREFDARRNGLTLLRLGLALVVVVTHGQVNGFGWQGHVGVTQIGQLAVDGFFVISGLLVTRSYLSLGSFPRFAWHRFLRIMPGFWTCLVLTAVVMAPVVALIERGSAASAFSGDSSAQTYVAFNAGLKMLQYDIAGLLSGVPSDGVFNGSLWTLSYEALCYALLGVVGACGILVRRRWLVGLGLLGLWAALIVVDVGIVTLPGTTLTFVLRFAFLFALGATAWLYADRLPITAPLAVLSGSLLVLGLLTQDDYRVVGGVGLAYLLVFVTVRVPVPWSPRADLSYGLYIYHFPVQQLLALSGLAALGVAPFIALSMLGAAACAVASWHLVESPALAQKDAGWVRHLERRRVREAA